MTQLLISPFSLSVLNVAVMVSLLIVFLWQIPNKQPATRNLLTFLLGADMVFFAFFYIFSSLDPAATQIAWWLLHGVVFSILFLIQFAYHYPCSNFSVEARRIFWLSLAISASVYLFYIYHTTLLEPVFDPKGGLYVYLETPEIGILVGLELAWMIAVLARQLKLLRQQDTATSRKQVSAIRKLSLILLSPVVLIVMIVLAYLDMVSWGVVGHILGSGLMVFVLLFTVVYLNNALEPSTLQMKIIGMSLGAILVLLGFSSSITLDLYHEAFLDSKRAELEKIEDKLAAMDFSALPQSIAFIEHNHSRHFRAATPRATAVTDRPWQTGWHFLQLNGNDPAHYYISQTLHLGKEQYRVGYFYQEYRAYIHHMAWPLLMILIAAVAFVVIAFPLFFRLSLFQPLQRLLRGVASIEQGNLDITIPVTVRDEIGGLTASFNSMARAVGDAQKKLHTAYTHQLDLTEAYSRFVPKEILSTLNKKSILDLGLGDNVRREMTVLFSDIRSFTTISESMSPEEIFRFINRYLENVGPIIRHHGGYIDKYIGDAVMALFPRGPDDAVATAIEMQRQAQLFNTQGSSSSEFNAEIHIGVGIHTGDLMLGTIGEPQRMEGTVISDAVNLASRIEGLTKLYRAPVLISYATYEKLQHPEKFQTRHLDRVRVKGKHQWVEIIEVLDGEVEAAREEKYHLKHRFGDGVKAFQQGEFEQALILFRELKEENANDKAIDIYIERCEQFIEMGIPPGWDGAVKL